LISQILKELIAAGLQGEALIAAIERIEQAQPEPIDAAADRRRAKDRERKRLQRGTPAPSSPRKSAEIRGLHGIPRKSAETRKEALSSLLSALSSNTKQTESKEVSKKERARKTQLPADWKPKPSHYDMAEKYKQPYSFVDQKADDLRDWAIGKGIIRADWDRTFNGFLKPKEGRFNGHGGPRPLQDDSKSISRAAERLGEAAKRGEFTFGPRPTLLPQENADPIRLLPKG
jgi:hypothetical protein